tara:strand:+ start:8275 stop:9006 length:732 start_codon:yes stop_codon:yes gene_type:complete
MPYELTYKLFGERAILVEWPAKIDKQILQDILSFKDSIGEKYIKQTLELKSSYNALLIFYSHKIKNKKTEFQTLNKIYHSGSPKIKRQSNLWKIPVCYNDKFGLDLEVISKEKGMPKTAIIKCHSEAVYTVYFIGFLPGFLYLGGLDKMLHTPRKPTPRSHIEKGAVAIGGNQTGVYPNASPGGWNVIGNSPINFFDVSKDIPCFAKAGDQIQFYSVSVKEYHDIKILVDAKLYQLESEVLDG